MDEPNRTKDDLYHEMAADAVMRTALGLDSAADGWTLERLSDGVLRIGHSEETTDCWWRVNNPAVLLGSDLGAPTDARRELLSTMGKNLTAALHKLQSLAFDHPNTPHATRVRFRETHLHKATEGVRNALRVVEAAKTARASSGASVSAANGSSSAYSQLMWLEARALTDPPLGAAGAQPSELMALQDTTSWASHLPVAPFGRSQSYHAAAARPTSGLGEYNNPAMYYN